MPSDAVSTCEVCDRPFVPRSRGNDANRCCSRECGFELRRDRRYVHWHFKYCTYCGTLFRFDNEHRLTCSLDCRRQRLLAVYSKRYHAAKKTTPIVKNCGACNLPITVARIRGACNSLCEPCVLANRRKQRGDKHFRTRARAAGVPYNPIKRSDVVERHGMICWICGGEIEVKGADPTMGLSLDHVVPMALGGWHDLINLRPAHLRCNSSKGDTFSGQLMLLMTPIA